MLAAMFPGTTQHRKHRDFSRESRGAAGPRSGMGSSSGSSPGSSGSTSVAAPQGKKRLLSLPPDEGTAFNYLLIKESDSNTQMTFQQLCTHFVSKLKYYYIIVFNLHALIATINSSYYNKNVKI